CLPRGGPPISRAEDARRSGGVEDSTGSWNSSRPANSRTKLAHRGQHDAGSGFGGEVKTFQTSPHLAHLNCRITICLTFSPSVERRDPPTAVAGPPGRLHRETWPRGRGSQRA